MNFAVLTLEMMTTGVALLVLVADLFVAEKHSRKRLAYLSAAGLSLVCLFSFTQYGMNATFWNGMFKLDDYAVFMKQVFLVGAILTILFSIESVDRFPHSRAEFYVLLLFAVVGMMVLTSANDLITLYVGLELMTMSFFIMVGYVLVDSRPTEAAIKYLVLASAASAVMLYGMSLLFGATGQVTYGGMVKALSLSPAVVIGCVLMLAGFAFKISAPPFHAWSPDVYEGAPTPVTALLAMGSKAAGFAALTRVFITVLPATGYLWFIIVLIPAAAAMLIGNLAAIPQTNVKRMLAYSSIAQAGYILTGLLAANIDGVKGILFYLMIYVFANVGAFAVVAAVNNVRDGESLVDFSGLARQSPILAAVMTVSLLSMAGIPPLAGFVGKFFLFAAAIDAGFLWIAVLGFVLSMVSVYYYLMVVKSMYLGESPDEKPYVLSATLKCTAFLAMAVTVLLGVYPGPLSRLAEIAAKVVFKI